MFNCRDVSLYNNNDNHINYQYKNHLNHTTCGKSWFSVPFDWAEPLNSRIIRKVSWLWVPGTSGKRCERCEDFEREETGDRRCYLESTKENCLQTAASSKYFVFFFVSLSWKFMKWCKNMLGEDCRKIVRSKDSGNRGVFLDDCGPNESFTQQKKTWWQHSPASGRSPVQLGKFLLFIPLFFSKKTSRITPTPPIHAVLFNYWKWPKKNTLDFQL